MRSITECQIYLTRDCNLGCRHCGLYCQEYPELNFDQWCRGFENLKTVGVKTIKIMGGEPTIKAWLPELIEHGNNLGLKIGLLSNSVFDPTNIDLYAQAGLFGFYTSVDVVGESQSVDQDATLKSQRGYQMLQKCMGKGIPILAANVVISKANILGVPNLVQRLSDQGVWSNLCAIQKSYDPRKIFSRTDTPDELMFTESDEELLTSIAERLMDMKQKGVRISVPRVYLEDLARYGVHNNWICQNHYQLRVDSTGGIMMCNEYPTILADKYNITKLDSDQYQVFLEEWRQVRKTVECEGCYWSCFIQAKHNLENGLNEFDFVSNN